MMITKTVIVTPEEKKHIQSTYERNEIEIEKDVSDIKEWLKKQPHLPQDEDEIRIRNMLLLNKCSVEKTKKKLDSYYSLKHLIPEYYENREPLHPSVNAIMSHVGFFPLPRLTAECHRVYVSRYLNDDAEKFNFTTYFKMIFAIFDLQLMDDLSLGDHYIIDFQLCTFAHIVQMTPTNISKAYTLLERSYSDRIKGLHCIHLPPAANPVVLLLNSILSKKVANRVHIHKNFESLHKIISRKILPFEYGGEAGASNDLYGEWRTYLRSRNDWIKEIGNKKSDETKRINENPDSDLFGTCGSFRKLNVD